MEIRRPSSEELERQRASKEDDIYVPESERPESLDVLIEVSPEILAHDRMLYEYHQTIRSYHVKFLKLAIESGMEPQPGAYPPLDDLPEIPLMEYSITLDPLDDDRTIEKKLDRFKEIALAEVRKKRDNLRGRGLPDWYMDKPRLMGWAARFLRGQITNRKGTPKTISSLKTELETSLQVYRLY
jgi:hypothetical protein